MRKRRLPPPTFALQRLRGASLRSLADKYRVSFKVANGWQWTALQTTRRSLRPPALCRALAEQILKRPLVDGNLFWFAQQARNCLDDEDTVAVKVAARDHAYAMLKGGHLMMTYPPSLPSQTRRNDA